MDVAVSLFTVAFIIALGFFADIFFSKTKVPDVIWLLLFGILLGSVLKVVDKAALFEMAPLFTAIAIAIILFESGRKMKFKQLLRDAPSATVFMLINFGMSTLAVTLGGTYLFGMETGRALLLGVIVAGTSSPMIVTIVDKLGIGNRARTMMSVESIINSPFVIVIGLVIMDSLTSPSGIFGFGYASKNILRIFIISFTVGLLVGVFWAVILKKIESYKYHHMMTLAMLFFTYVFSQYIGGSGALASLIMGITMGNSGSFSESFSKITRKEVAVLTKETKDFFAIIAFLVRTFFFVFIGALASLDDYRSISIGLALTGLILLARFLVVYPTSLFLKLRRREFLTMSLMIPTGLSAAVLAVLPFSQYGIPGTENFVDIVFTIILATTIFATISIGFVEYFYNRKDLLEKKTKNSKV